MIRMKVFCVADEREFFELEEAWNRLLLKSRANNIFLTHEWVRNWWRVYGKGKKLCVLIAEDGQEIIGIAPLYEERVRFFGLLRIKKIRFLGDCYVGSDFLDFILFREREKEILEAFFKYLMKEVNWDLLLLQDMREDALSAGLLKDIARDNRLFIFKSFLYSCPFMEMPNTFEEFMKQPDETFKKISFKKNMKKLFKQPNAAFETVASSEQLPAALEDLFELHNFRRTLVGGTGIFTNQELRQFYHLASLDLLQKGYLKIFFIMLDGKKVAISYNLLYEQKNYFLQTGCSEVGLKLKAGTVLMAKILENFMGKIYEFHFLRGEESYKYLWGAHDLLAYRFELWRGKRWFLVGHTVDFFKKIRLFLKRILAMIKLKKKP